MMKAGVEADITAKVNVARAVFTNSILKVLARTCLRSVIENITDANTILTDLINTVNVTIKSSMLVR